MAFSILTNLIRKNSLMALNLLVGTLLSFSSLIVYFYTKSDLYLDIAGWALVFEALAFSIYMGMKWTRFRQSVMTIFTEQLKTEKALDESEQRFKKFAEATREGIVIHDLGIESSHIVDVNKAFAEMVGLSPSEIVGKDPLEFVSLEVADRARLVRRGLVPPSSVIEIHLKHANGNWVPVEIVRNEIIWNGQKMRMLQFWNLSERKKSEQALIEKEERFRKFAEATREGILIHDKGVILDVNQALADMVGMKVENFIGKDSFFFVSEEGASVIKKIRSGELPDVTYEITIKHSDGTLIPVETFGVHTLWGDKKVRMAKIWNITERKKIEKALLESQERFARFAEVTREGILIHDKGLMIDCNQALLDMTGYSREELMGKMSDEFMDKDSIKVVKEFRTKGYTNQPYEITVRKKDGGRIPVEAHGASFSLGGKELRVVRLWDITERKAAEEALRQSESSFRNLIEKSPDGVLIHTLEEPPKAVYVNDALLKFTGYAAEELVGKKPDYFAHTKDQPGIEQRIARIRENGSYNPPQEKTFIRKDGQLVYVEAVSFMVHYQGERMAAVVIRDLTERKKAEEAARKNEERFLRVYENSPIGIALVGADYKLFSVNPKLAQILGYSIEELTGKTFEEITHPDDLQADRDNAGRLFSGEINSYKVEKRYIRKDGHIVWGNLTATMIRDDLGAPLYGLGMVEDITESKKTQDVLMRFERLSAIGEMAAGMAHEIRNPLAAISAAAQVLQRKKPKEDTGQLETILQQSDRLEKLIRDTLDYARPQAAPGSLSFSVKVALESAVRLSQVQFGPAHRNIKVEWVLPKKDVQLRMDLGRFQQILVNLILNAFQILKQEGTVKLGFEVHKKDVLIRVEDNGPGIGEKNIERIFEPFFTTKETGSGLGLAISQRIAQEYGGLVTVEKVLPHGAAFILRLPCLGDDQ